MDRIAEGGGVSSGVSATPARERQAGLTDLERLYEEALGDLERDLKDYEPYDWIPPVPRQDTVDGERWEDSLRPARGLAVGFGLAGWVLALGLLVAWWLE